MKRKINKFNYVICKFCNWVHFKVSRKYAINEVNKFNKYFNSLSKEDQVLFYKNTKASIRNYECCNLCGTCYHNFRRAKKNELPNGSTISPIIDRKD
jgi:protein-arginine kinase activator protein McsA